MYDCEDCMLPASVVISISIVRGDEQFTLLKTENQKSFCNLCALNRGLIGKPANEKLEAAENVYTNPGFKAPKRRISL